MPRPIYSTHMLDICRAITSYERLLESEIWSTDSAEPAGVNRKGVIKFKEISTNNIRKLSEKLGVLTGQEQSFLSEYTKANPTLTHYTNSADKILKSGKLISTVGLKKSAPDALFSNSLGDIQTLCNDDFVFFRYEIEHDQTKFSRFGKEEIITTGEDSILFNFGWVSIYEMWCPDSASVLSKISIDGNIIRTGYTSSSDIDSNSDSDSDSDSNSNWESDSDSDIESISTDGSVEDSSYLINYQYPESGNELQIDLREYVFFASDIRLGLGLSIIEQLRLIGGAYQAKYLSELTLDNFTHLSNYLFRPEAKLPRSFSMIPGKFRLQVNPGYKLLEDECKKEVPNIDAIMDIIKKYRINTNLVIHPSHIPGSVPECYIDLVVHSLTKNRPTKEQFSSLIKQLEIIPETSGYHVFFNLFNIYAQYFPQKQDALDEFISLFSNIDPKNLLAYLLVSSVEHNEPYILISAILTRKINMHECNTDEEIPQYLLLVAIKKADITIIEALIRKGFDVNYNKFASATPLVTAIQENKVAVVQLLLSNGASPELKSSSVNPISAIEAAQQSANPEIRELFDIPRITKPGL